MRTVQRFASAVGARAVVRVEPLSAHDQLLQRRLSADTFGSFPSQGLYIVAITLTRSNPQGEIGFLSDTRRMNVGMTRTAQAVAGGRFVQALEASVNKAHVQCTTQRCCKEIQGAGNTALLNRFTRRSFSLRSNSRIGAVR